MTETFDSLLLPVDDAARLPSPSTTPRFTGPRLAIGVMADWRTSSQHMTALSPPPTPRTALSPRPGKLSLKLGSHSGLALHTNQAAFRQYTDYNSDGSLLSPQSPPLTSPALSSGPGFVVANIDQVSMGEQPKELIETPLTPSPPVLDLFHRDVVRAALNTPTTGQRLCAFAQARNRGADVAFLLKVEEYLAALKYLTSMLNTISKTFTSVSASSPVSLPYELSDNINVHIKHFARSMFPVLERMFRDATTAIEDRIARDVYPEFLKYQFSQCMASSLSTSRSLTGGFKTAYPGLGDAFCLTDPSQPGHPMVYASDALFQMSGFQRYEVLGNNCRIFQGMSTNEETIRRLGAAIASDREVSELVLNHKRDGTAYWNLLFVTPLVEKGKVRYFLGGQINVSESMGMQYKDILQILNIGPPLADKPKGKGSMTEERAHKRMSGSQDKGDRESSIKSNDPRRRSERSFFRSFARKSTQFAGQQQNSTRPGSRRGNSIERDERDRYNRTNPSPPRPPTGTRRMTVSRSVVEEEAHTPYSIFFVLGYQAPTSPGSPPDRDRDQRRARKATTTRLPVTFASARALALLGLEPRDRDVVLGTDVFAMLAEQAGSPTVSRTLKCAVRDRLNAGEAISVDLLIQADPSARQTLRRAKKSSMLSLSTAASASLGMSSEPSDGGRDPTPPPYLAYLATQGSEDRGGADMVSGFFGSKMRRLVSHWTPLKGHDGKTAWVVLVMTPAAS